VSALRLGVDPPFRLRAVVLSHGWFQTEPFAWDDATGALRRIESLPDGPVGLTVRQTPGGVTAAADRALSATDRTLVRRRLRRMLQLDADLAGFHAALAGDPDLDADLVAFGAGRLLAGTSLYEDVVKAICGTNILWSQAVRCIARIAAWGEGGAFPQPERLLAAGDERLRVEARVGYRAPALLDAARAALDGRLADIERDAPTLEGPGLAARLRGLVGVGPSTAGFLCLLLGRYDVAGVDSATIRLAGRVWFDDARPTPAQVLARAEAFGPWRGLALYWACMRAWHRESGLEAAQA
jgi:AraC family transcriptional regulator of adaptative response / DNA-3-methyladenine glycosylase II